MSRIYGLLLLLATAGIITAGKPEPPPKELVDYIRHSRTAGMNDDVTRRNALAAGWDPKIISDAFASESNPAPERGPAGSTGLPDGYRIGPGDVLQISVFREPDASVPSATVRSDGKISVPLIKEVEVVGLTAAEAERLLSEKLSRFIHSADVTVIVSQINSRKIYLVGGIRTVGPIDLKGPLTILQAITQGGGLTDYAKRKQIYVLRTENGKQLRLFFNYDSVIKGENMEQNILLLPNDTVVIPQ